MLKGTHQAIVSEGYLLTAHATIKRVLLEEAEALKDFAGNLEGCVAASEFIFHSTGPVVVTGMGKSGHIAKKVAATFRSLGKPAIFLHPAEASHGDLGMVLEGSIVLAISNSGETSELSDLLHYCSLKAIPIIALTGEKNSTLAKASDVAIVYGEVYEACHNGLAPTTSTTLSLGIGDALAVSVSEMMGKLPTDFYNFHPGGKLGARLTKVREIMRSGDKLPTVEFTASISEVVVTISEKALGVVVLVKNGAVDGIITDGDLRRNVSRLWKVKPKEIATADPIWVGEDWLVSDVANLMSTEGISICLVGRENGELKGIIHIHDCVKSGAT